MGLCKFRRRKDNLIFFSFFFFFFLVIQFWGEWRHGALCRVAGRGVFLFMKCTAQVNSANRKGRIGLRGRGGVAGG